MPDPGNVKINKASLRTQSFRERGNSFKSGSTRMAWRLAFPKLVYGNTILNFLFILESSGESEKRMAWDWNTGIVLTIESISTDIFYLTIECTY